MQTLCVRTYFTLTCVPETVRYIIHCICVCVSCVYVYLCMCVHKRGWVKVHFIYIKTHDSESRGQEEAGRTRRMSVLFTGSTAVKLVNALNKPL